jgi:hypothetical protein
MIGKYSKHWRPLKMSVYEYQGDGRFPKERIKGKDKQILKKRTRLKEKREYDATWSEP